MLSVLFRYTDSDYPLLQTLLVESGVNHHPHNHINQTLIFHQSQYEFLNQGVKINELNISKLIYLLLIPDLILICVFVLLYELFPLRRNGT